MEELKYIYDGYKNKLVLKEWEWNRLTVERYQALVNMHKDTSFIIDGDAKTVCAILKNVTL